ncbi:PLG [Symbiodinium necroappetens]|uniref:PLG protein n=1 Tax=Symbiodinium necroappetens TaxID=1628268 RepID=A0A812T249_9DINO|nr:PLG [Symbiodinium necroappetens]
MTDVIRCMHCHCKTPLVSAYKRGKHYSCPDCNAARIALQKHMKEIGQWDRWQRMSQDQRNEEIRQNKGRSKGKGKKFEVVVSEKVKVSDSISMEKNKEYVNQREFRKGCKNRWGLRGKEADMRWQDLLSDVNVPKSKDQMGWTTMPVLHCFTQRGTRKLEHTKEIGTDQLREVDRFADFTDATVLEVEAATQVKKGGKNKLPPKRKGAGEINPKDVLEDEPNRKRPRHKDAEKDVARIGALRSRRSAVDQTVGSSVSGVQGVLNGAGWMDEWFPVKRMGDILKDTAELVYMVTEKPEFAKELEMYLNLIAKSAWRLFAAVPSEVKDQESSVHKEMMARVDAVGSEEAVRGVEASPLTKTTLEKAFNNDDDLDPKAVKAWERSVKALFAALEVATFACAAAEEQEEDEAGATAEEAEEDEAAKAAGALGDGSGGGDADESLHTSENYKLTWPVMEAMGSKFSHLRDSVTLIGAATDLTQLDMNDVPVPVLYDGWTAHLPQPLLEEFHTFIEHKNPLPPMSRTKLQCRGTMRLESLLRSDQTTPASAESSDWDLVSSAFWGAWEFNKYGESFFSKVNNDLTADVRKKLQAERLFQQRWQCIREGHVFKGINEMLLPRMVACITGTRFICGAPLQDLCQHLSEKLGDDWAGSFLQLCDQLPQLSAQELGDVGGFFVVLKEKQMIEIPAGYVFAEAPLTPASVGSYWSVLRRGCSAGVLRDAGFSLGDMIELDLQKHRQGNEEFLDRVHAQVQAVPTFVGWAIFRGNLASEKGEERPDAEEPVTKAVTAEVKQPAQLALANQAFVNDELDMHAEGEVSAANPDSVPTTIDYAATQSAAQDAGSTPSAVPAEVSPEVNAEMREGATLLLEHLEKVYKPDVDRNTFLGKSIRDAAGVQFIDVRTGVAALQGMISAEPGTAPLQPKREPNLEADDAPTMVDLTDSPSPAGPPDLEPGPTVTAAAPSCPSSPAASQSNRRLRGKTPNQFDEAALAIMEMRDRISKTVAEKSLQEAAKPGHTGPKVKSEAPHERGRGRGGRGRGLHAPKAAAKQKSKQTEAKNPRRSRRVAAAKAKVASAAVLADDNSSDATDEDDDYNNPEHSPKRCRGGR